VCDACGSRPHSFARQLTVMIQSRVSSQPLTESVWRHAGRQLHRGSVPAGPDRCTQMPRRCRADRSPGMSDPESHCTSFPPAPCEAAGRGPLAAAFSPVENLSHRLILSVHTSAASSRQLASSVLPRLALYGALPPSLVPQLLPALASEDKRAAALAAYLLQVQLGVGTAGTPTLPPTRGGPFTTSLQISLEACYKPAAGAAVGRHRRHARAAPEARQVFSEMCRLSASGPLILVVRTAGVRRRRHAHAAADAR